MKFSDLSLNCLLLTYIKVRAGIVNKLTLTFVRGVCTLNQINYQGLHFVRLFFFFFVTFDLMTQSHRLWDSPNSSPYLPPMVDSSTLRQYYS